jgi:hypothetical protein
MLVGMPCSGERSDGPGACRAGASLHIGTGELPLCRRRRTQPRAAAPAGRRPGAGVRVGYNRASEIARPSWLQKSAARAARAAGTNQACKRQFRPRSPVVGSLDDGAPGGSRPGVAVGRRPGEFEAPAVGCELP